MTPSLHPHPEVDVLIVGGGIAGWCAAYFAARKGRAVTLIDAGIEPASAVPTALINPVRGYHARVLPGGIEGAAFTFLLLQDLARTGHAVCFGRGLWRPIPDLVTRDRWMEALPVGLEHTWHVRGSFDLPFQGEWAGALFLPRSGWVQSQTLLGALKAETGIDPLRATVVKVSSKENCVVLSDGTRVSAKALLWCGGAWGAAQIAGPAQFRPGSVLLTAKALSNVAVSYGLYCAPSGSGSIIGPSTEPPRANYPAPWEAHAAGQRLIERARLLFGDDLEVAAQWQGVRLESARLPSGLAHLGALGSAGYLLAPHAAWRWAETL